MAFSPLARGVGTWAGDLFHQQDAEKVYSPALPLLVGEEAHRHGVTVAPRSKSACSYRSTVTTVTGDKHDGELNLPKTYITRKGALVLFTAPDDLEQMTENDRLYLRKAQKLLKNRYAEYSEKFGSLGRLAQSVLTFGDETHETCEKDHGSISDKDSKTFLKFLHNLDNQGIDVHAQPGADPSFYLKDLQSRSTTGSAISRMLASARRSATDLSQSGASGRESAELLSPDSGRLVGRLGRPGSSASSNRSLRTKSGSLKPGKPLSANKLRATLKSAGHSSITSTSQQATILEIDSPPYDMSRPPTPSTRPSTATAMRPGSSPARRRSRPSSMTSLSKFGKTSSNGEDGISSQHAPVVVEEANENGGSSARGIPQHPTEAWGSEPIHALRDEQISVALGEGGTGVTGVSGGEASPMLLDDKDDLVQEEDTDAREEDEVEPKVDMADSRHFDQMINQMDRASHDTELSQAEHLSAGGHGGLTDGDSTEDGVQYDEDGTRVVDPLMPVYEVSGAQSRGGSFSFDAAMDDTIADDDDDVLDTSLVLSDRSRSRSNPVGFGTGGDTDLGADDDFLADDLNPRVSSGHRPLSGVSSHSGQPSSRPETTLANLYQDGRRDSARSNRTSNLDDEDAVSAKQVNSRPGSGLIDKTIDLTSTDRQEGQQVKAEMSDSEEGQQVKAGDPEEGQEVKPGLANDVVDLKSAGDSQKDISPSGKTGDHGDEIVSKNLPPAGEPQDISEEVQKKGDQATEKQQDAPPQDPTPQAQTSPPPTSTTPAEALPPKKDSTKPAAPKSAPAAAPKKDTKKPSPSNAKKDYVKAFNITSQQAPPSPPKEKHKPVVRAQSPAKPKPEKKVDLQAELAELMAQTKPAQEEKKKPVLLPPRPPSPPPVPKKTKEEEKLEKIEQEVTQLFDEEDTEPGSEDVGLTAEEMELEQQILKEKMQSAQAKLQQEEAAAAKKTKGKKKAAPAKKKKKEKKEIEQPTRDLAKEREALREARRLERQKQLEDAKKLEAQIREKEEEKSRQQRDADIRAKEIQQELQEIKAEEQEAQDAEEEAREMMAAARRTARIEREAKRKAEQERKKQEAQEKREKERQMIEAARAKERAMLEQIAGAEDRKKMAEEDRRRREEEEEIERERQEEEEQRLKLFAEEEEERIREMERQAEEEAIARLVQDREEAEERRYQLQVEAEKMRAQEERKKQALEAERLRLEEVQRQREEQEIRRRLEDEQRKLELQKQREEAAEKIKEEVAQRRELLLRRRDQNLERRSQLRSMKHGQGMTKPWIFSYYVTWPRETYDRKIGGEEKKKKGFRPKPKPKPKPDG